MKTYHWTSSNGRLHLTLSEDQVSTCAHSGDCEADVRWTLAEDDIESQVAEWDPGDLKRELREYGAWDDEELSDHEMNIVRMLWLAANDCRENPDDYEVDDAD